jgi:hypothetical protein
MLALGFISLPHTLTIVVVNLVSYSPPLVSLGVVTTGFGKLTYYFIWVDSYKNGS